MAAARGLTDGPRKNRRSLVQCHADAGVRDFGQLNKFLFALN
jgi:hypothetical protein